MAFQCRITSRPKASASFQKRVGHRQFSDLGMQIPDLILIDHRRLAATAFKDTGRAIEQRAFPLIDHRRMHAEPARQFRHGLLAFQRLKCRFRLDIVDLPRDEDQQTAKTELTSVPSFQAAPHIMFCIFTLLQGFAVQKALYEVCFSKIF
jgi:hypothetical protein